MKSALLIALFGVFFISCAEEDKWPAESEREFTENCASSYVESFESTMGDMMSDVNRTKLDKLSKKQCACMYETLKKNYESAEEAFKVGYDELLAKSSGCEPTDAEIDDLLVK